MTKEDEKRAAGAAPKPEAATAPGDSSDVHKKRGRGRKDKPPGPVDTLKQARDAAEAARLETQDRLLRLQADFENFRKRTLRERGELYRMANEDLLTELLPVLDHFELALGAAGGSQAVPDALVDGVRMVRDQLVAALGKFGLTPLDAGGSPFDPDLHEAISHLPSETVPENGVMAQTRRGYKLGDKLLRPVQVVVSSGSATADARAGADAGTADEGKE